MENRYSSSNYLKGIKLISNSRNQIFKITVNKNTFVKYRRLGNSGLRVSEISLGSMFYGGAQYLATDNPVSKEDAIKSIKRAMELDINHLDCADIYGAYGKAEKIFGEALEGVDREEISLTSKVMMPMSRNEFDRGLNRKHMMKSIDRTLENMRTDYLDLYYAHRYDNVTPMEELIKTMNMLIENGKIRYWGTSNWSPAELERTHAYCEKHGLEGPIVDQTKYNLFMRYPTEIALPYTLEEYGMGLVPYKILAEGVFAGLYGGKSFDNMDEKEKKAVSGQLARNNAVLSQEILDSLTKFDELAKSLDVTPAQLTYAWVLRLSTVSTALMSTRNPDRIDENLGALEINLSPETIAEINQLFRHEYSHYDTYYRIKSMPGPNLIGKITEEMMRF